jgi:hypothetical protein
VYNIGRSKVAIELFYNPANPAAVHHPASEANRSSKQHALLAA